MRAHQARILLAVRRWVRFAGTGRFTLERWILRASTFPQPRPRPAPSTPLRPRRHTLRPGQANRVFFMQGGPSQVDLFDPKPKLNQLHGQRYFRQIAADVSSPEQAGGLLGTPFSFKQYGENGTAQQSTNSHHWDSMKPAASAATQKALLPHLVVPNIAVAPKRPQRKNPLNKK